MRIPEDLLELLACPACKTDVLLDEENSVIRCRSCGRTFAIREGIPDMLLQDTALPEQ